jgi:hypothetical protein
MTEEENKLLRKLSNFIMYKSFTDTDFIIWYAPIKINVKAITKYFCYICELFFDDKEKLYIHAKEHLAEAKRIENLKEFL